LDSSGSRPAGSSSPAPRAKVGGSAPKGGENLQFANESELKAVIHHLRTGPSAEEGGINWVLFGYEGGDSNTVVLLGQGSGGVNELVSQLSDSTVAYGLVKEIERIDESNTVKFAFINWVGENIPRMLRARLGTHSGAIQQFLTPYHVDIKPTQKGEVTEEIVRETIKRAAGTANRVLEKGSNPSPAFRSGGPSSGGSKGVAGKVSLPASASAPGGVKVIDEEEVRATLQQVRSDGSPTNWALVGYENPSSNNLVLIGKGTGGIEELTSHLHNDIVGYALLREIERIDESNTVKFVFIDWTGENINRMLRARLGTHSGVVKDTFSPYHVDLHTSDISEVSEDHIRKIIKKAAGTANYVQ